MRALGRPRWGDIKEHAALPVKPYCFTRSECVCADYTDLIGNAGWSRFIPVNDIHDWRRSPYAGPHDKPKSQLRSAWTSCLVTWSLAVSHKELQQISVSFSSTMSFVFWFQILKSNDLLIFFVFYDNKWRVFGFWTSGLTKEAIWRCHFGLWEIVMSITHISWLFAFFDKMIIHKNLNNHWLQL